MRNHFLRTIADGPAVSFTHSASSTADATSYTFNNCAIGAAAADRFVIVAVQVGQTGGSIAGVTIDGVAATLLAYSGTGDVCTALYGRLVTTGTTTTVVVNPSSVNRCAIQVYAAYGLNSTTPFDTYVQYVAADTDGITGTIDTSRGGFVVACFASQTTSSVLGVTWTGVDEDYSAHVETQRYSSASRRAMRDSLNNTITAARADGTNAVALSAISMR